MGLAGTAAGGGTSGSIRPSGRLKQSEAAVGPVVDVIALAKPHAAAREAAAAVAVMERSP